MNFTVVPLGSALPKKLWRQGPQEINMRCLWGILWRIHVMKPAQGNVGESAVHKLRANSNF